MLVFGAGLMLTVYLARSYTKPIEEVVAVAQASGRQPNQN
jgi:hypothetical protein